MLSVGSNLSEAEDESGGTPKIKPRDPRRQPIVTSEWDVENTGSDMNTADEVSSSTLDRVSYLPMESPAITSKNTLKKVNFKQRDPPPAPSAYVDMADQTSVDDSDAFDVTLDEDGIAVQFVGCTRVVCSSAVESE